MSLTLEQRQRYSRTIQLPGVGREGQQRLLGATVAIVGCGALGSTAALYLAGSGVGHMRIADFDSVDISNLQRQVAYSMAELGTSKASALAARIADLNPDVEVSVHQGLLTPDSIDGYIAGADIVIEGSDNPSTKYLVTDAAHRASLPCILGAVGPASAQLLTIAAKADPQTQTPTYRRLFPEGPDPDGFTPCSLGGLLGPLPGIIATMQATAAINHLLGLEPVTDSLHLLDPHKLTMRTLRL